MLLAAIILFGLAAVGGSVLALKRKNDEPTPAALSAGHGLLAVAGLVLLIVGVLDAATVSTLAGAAVAGFALTALGGFGLLVLRRLGKPPGLGIIAGHAFIAVTSLVLLVVAYAGAG